jgi:hypothetical protein
MKPHYIGSTLFRTIPIALALLAFGPQVYAAGEPNGSYRLTCSKISVVGDSLKADCRKLNGATQATTLADLGACLNDITKDGDIGNIDGNLVCLPDLPKPDPSMVFPTSETTINKWVYGGDVKAMYQHSWQIWAGLTQVVGVVDGAPVRAFETWATTSNMLYRTNAGLTLAEAAKAPTPSAPPVLELGIPRQFRGMVKERKLKLLSREEVAKSKVGDTNIFVSVAYNPPAAKHAISNKLLLQSTLDTLLKNGYTEIPNFPNNAITIKPVYKVIPKNTPNGIYTFPGWPGTPTPAVSFPESNWNSCVYVDINGSGPGGNSIDAGCKGRSAQNTFFLNNFIHRKLTQQDAQYLKSQLGLNAVAGDYAILVGMHVTTRETKRWVWQTYWWSANADKPYTPSSSAIAAARPVKYLDAAAQHYAMAVAYSMVAPAQPIIGGKNVGASVIAYNPHLEAGFDPSTFQIVRDINGTINNKYGVQTNCMTCHNLALYNPKTNYSVDGGANRETPYGSDYYMSLTDPTFNGTLKLDFAWSILGVLELDGKSK